MTFWSASSGLARVSAAALLVLSPVAAGAQRQNGVLVGRVLSGDVAVPGAAIIVSGGRVTLARVDGRFRLSLPAGTYAVRAQRIGYTSALDSITIVGRDSAIANFRLERSASPLQSVSMLGARGAPRSAIAALDPVDVIDGAQLRVTGRTSTSQALASTSPSVTLDRSAMSEGSDLARTISMRGMNPDQVLVLVNGKRRHTSALVNTAHTTGRGASGTDLDAIPASLIDHVEILHGDAVAQYGSDAVAGVVNIVLKSGVHGEARSTAGANSTTFNGTDGVSAAYPGGTRSVSDGRAFQASIDKGVVFGQRGFLHGGVEVSDRGATSRVIPDTTTGSLATPAPSGDPRAHNAALFLNGGNLFDNGLDLYANLGGSRQVVDASTYFTSLGVPVIRGTLDDYAGTIGVRGAREEWRWDLSTVYGVNHTGLSVSPGIPLGGLPATVRPEADAGAQRFGQSTTNFDLRRDFSLFQELRLSTGAELRNESYRVTAGEPGAPTALGGEGWEGLLGYSPSLAGSRSRHVIGGYADLEAELSDALTVGAVGRLEHYSDVGQQSAGKLLVRFEPVPDIALRASVARGFRAPTLQESSLSREYVDGGSGVLLAPPASVRDMGFAADDLKAEKTTSYSAGVAAVLTPALSFTLDAYRTDVGDRIVLSDALLQVAPNGFVQVMRNGAVTRTDGLDATMTYLVRLAGSSSLRLTGGANLNRTSVRRVTPVASPFSPSASVDQQEQERLSAGRPRSNLLASANLALQNAGAMLRVQRFGAVSATLLAPYGTNPFANGGYGNAFTPTLQSHTFPARWVTDASVSYTLVRRYTFTAGADNLFDVYPERRPYNGNLGFGSYYGLQPYDGSSPFGFSGRHVYGRLAIYL